MLGLWYDSLTFPIWQHWVAWLGMITEFTLRGLLKLILYNFQKVEIYRNDSLGVCGGGVLWSLWKVYLGENVYLGDFVKVANQTLFKSCTHVQSTITTA